MDTLISTSLINTLKYYLDKDQQERLKHLFASYEKLEIARLGLAYSQGKLDYVLDNDDTFETFLNKKFGICEQ